MHVMKFRGGGGVLAYPMLLEAFGEVPFVDVLLLSRVKISFNTTKNVFVNAKRCFLLRFLLPLHLCKDYQS